MKKNIMLFFIALFLLFYVSTITAIVQDEVLKEGFYKAKDLNLSINKIYYAQNVSSKDDIFMLIFDGNENLQQSLRLKPQSPKYKLLPFGGEYKILIVGNGEVSLF